VGLDITYYKRFRMEIRLAGRQFHLRSLPKGYRLLPWDAALLEAFVEAKFNSFRDELDADVFRSLSTLEGCRQLMTDIAAKPGFQAGATWLMGYCPKESETPEYCGTIQGIRVSNRLAGIQNIGITPAHRQHGVGAALITAALTGFQQLGLPRVYLEVTAQNDPAVRLYQRLGFQRTKTLYKAVELAYS